MSGGVSAFALMTPTQGENLNVPEPVASRGERRQVVREALRFRPREIDSHLGHDVHDFGMNSLPGLGSR